MTTDLHGARVMVTGASLGIGREIAFAFAAAGSRLALTYREHGGEADEVAGRCRDLGSPDVVTIELDLADEESTRRCAELVEERFGEIDVLVNNAGVVRWRPFLQQSLEEIEEQIAVNLTGTLRLTWLLLPHVRDTVIVIASTASLHGTRTLAPYCASKWGVRGFVEGTRPGAARQAHRGRAPYGHRHAHERLRGDGAREGRRGRPARGAGRARHGVGQRRRRTRCREGRLSDAALPRGVDGDGTFGDRVAPTRGWAAG